MCVYTCVSVCHVVSVSVKQRYVFLSIRDIYCVCLCLSSITYTLSRRFYSRLVVLPRHAFLHLSNTSGPVKVSRE